MPHIGITVGRVSLEGRLRFHCPEDYVRAVLDAGGWPALLPPETILAAGREILRRYDGFLLSGGGDLDPGSFGQKPHPATGAPDKIRDRAELALARWAAEEGLPCLGICRGLQVLNVALGGDLLQDLPSAGYPGHDQSAGRAVRTHLVIPTKGSPLADLMPEPAPVNSFHHQAIGRLAPVLAVAGRSPDGILEAVYLPGRPILAVQWHPENFATVAPEAAALFAWLVAEAERRAADLGRSTVRAAVRRAGHHPA
ncbi:MAG: gamma-glutamyl-gamma-aminobutyrate hydrolase family protein [Bacteroidota bacterium]